MTRDELIAFHETICANARDLMQKKNRDYAGNDGVTPFANFTRTEAMGVCTTEQGFLVRMVDKMSRLSTFAEGGTLHVKDESVEDSLVDIINYAVLLGAYLADKKRIVENPTSVRDG